MILAHRKRGEPLLVLGLLIAGWIGARAFAWEHAVEAEQVIAAQSAARTATSGTFGLGLKSQVSATDAPAARAQKSGAGSAFAPPSTAAIAPMPRPLFEPLPPPSAMPAPVLPPAAYLGSPEPAVQPGPAPSPRVGVAGGHAMLWLAATALMPMPALGTQITPAPSAAPLRARRWSADGWLLMRRGNGAITPGPVYGNYGASQFGAVIRYRLDPVSQNKPSAYVRATAAANGTRQQEVALGLSARPMARVPVVAMAEMRAIRDSTGVRLHPAAMLVTELPPQPLPLRFTGELYAQGGYIGGRNPTAFIDGLIRAERPVADLGAATLSAGGGAWGARQRGAARLDLGPVASVRFRLNDHASARLEADWRFRIAGRAKPDSGPALTLSAGF